MLSTKTASSSLLLFTCENQGGSKGCQNQDREMDMCETDVLDGDVSDADVSDGDV